MTAQCPLYGQDYSYEVLSSNPTNISEGQVITGVTTVRIKVTPPPPSPMADHPLVGSEFLPKSQASAPSPGKNPLSKAHSAPSQNRAREAEPVKKEETSKTKAPKGKGLGGARGLGTAPSLISGISCQNGPTIDWYTHACGPIRP